MSGCPTRSDLGAALEAFILEHEYCGEMDRAVETDRVWMTCTCGVVISWTLEPTACVPDTVDLRGPKAK
jgi:hypothetical protein